MMELDPKALAVAQKAVREQVGEDLSTNVYTTSKAIAELAITAYLSVSPVSGDGWQGIETAQKDGTEVLLWLGAPWSKVEKARWYEPWRNWQCGTIPADPIREEMHGIGSAVPTHWRPLPAPPRDEVK